MSFVITTITGDFALSDLGGEVFIHPTTEDLSLKYELEELRASISLQTALAAGDISIAYEGNAITALSEIRYVTAQELSSLQTQSHTHSNLPILESILSAGSGDIITITERTKLQGIESGAQVNSTASEIKTLYESNLDTNTFTDSEKILVSLITQAGAGTLFLSDDGIYRSLSVSETDPVFTASPAGGISSTQISNWDISFSWGDHATAGYLTSYTETDPIFSASAASGIALGDISNWNTAFAWGDHSLEGYLTSFTEADPIFTASAAFGVSSGDIVNWNAAFGWGDHSAEGYLTSFTETDPIFSASPSAGIVSGDISNWNSAFSWGDHSTEGYLTEALHDALANDNPHSVSFTQAAGADPSTDITALEAEELTDGSITNLHLHRGLVDQTSTVRVDVLNGGEVQLGLYSSGKDDGVSSYNRNIYVDNSGVVKVGDNRSSFIFCSGRFYCYTNNRWVTDSDDNYGPGYYQFNENGGTGAAPIYEWEHMGTLLPAGTYIKALNILGRVNNTQVTDMEIIVVERKPTNPAANQSGFDADGEMTNTVLYSDTWRNAVGSFTGAMNDRHTAIIPIDHEISELAQISIYMRPVGTITGTRYFTASWTWEIK